MMYSNNATTAVATAIRKQSDVIKDQVRKPSIDGKEQMRKLIGEAKDQMKRPSLEAREHVRKLIEEAKEHMRRPSLEGKEHARKMSDEPREGTEHQQARKLSQEAKERTRKVSGENRGRKHSQDGKEHVRKISNESKEQTRKLSQEGKEKARKLSGESKERHRKSSATRKASHDQMKNVRWKKIRKLVMEKNIRKSEQTASQIQDEESVKGNKRMKQDSNESSQENRDITLEHSITSMNLAEFARSNRGLRQGKTSKSETSGELETSNKNALPPKNPLQRKTPNLETSGASEISNTDTATPPKQRKISKSETSRELETQNPEAHTPPKQRKTSASENSGELDTSNRDAVAQKPPPHRRMHASEHSGELETSVGSEASRIITPDESTDCAMKHIPGRSKLCTPDTTSTVSFEHSSTFYSGGTPDSSSFFCSDSTDWRKEKIPLEEAKKMNLELAKQLNYFIDVNYSRQGKTGYGGMKALDKDHPLAQDESNLRVSYSPGRLGGSFRLPFGGKVIVPEGVCHSRRDAVICQVTSPNDRWRFNSAFQDEHMTSEIFTFEGTGTLSTKKGLEKKRSQPDKSGSSDDKPPGLVVMIPFNPPPPSRFLELNVKGIWKDEAEWTDVGFIEKTLPIRKRKSTMHVRKVASNVSDTKAVESTEDAGGIPVVELQLNKLGTFCVTFRRKVDNFSMGAIGGLYHSRLNRNLSIRFPKRAIETTINYDLQIDPIPPEVVETCQQYFSLECYDLLKASEFYDMKPDGNCPFKRTCTIKLPLPQDVALEDEVAQDIYVLHKDPDTDVWNWVEGKYKYTRYSVSVEVKNPNKFLVVQSKPERGKKMAEAAAVVEQRMGRAVGEVGVFLYIKPKAWYLVLEVFQKERESEVVEKRVKQGFQVVPKHLTPALPVDRFRTISSTTLLLSKVKHIETFELFDGLTWNMTFKPGVVAISTPQSELGENSQLQCYRYLNTSYRHFQIEPVAQEELSAISASLVLEPVGIAFPKQREQLAMTFDLEVPEKVVVDYFYVPPEPEEVAVEEPPATAPSPGKVGRTKMPMPTAVDHSKPKTYSITNLERLARAKYQVTPTLPVKAHSDHKYRAAPPPPAEEITYVKPRVFDPEHTERLASVQARHMASNVDREAKVISGRSLKILSRVVANEGLTLAVQLGLQESTITGIGFDALANGSSMTEVAYRILMFWKRSCRDKREGAVTQLIQSLKGIGRDGVAQLIQEYHIQNRELTLDSLVQAVSGGAFLGSVDSKSVQSIPSFHQVDS